MLVRNPQTVIDKIVTVKLKNGEEVIGKCVDVGNEFIELNKPMAVRVINEMDSAGRPVSGVGLTKVAITVDEDRTIIFDKETIFFVTQTMQEFADQYVSMTSPIIQTKKSIIT